MFFINCKNILTEYFWKKDPYNSIIMTQFFSAHRSKNSRIHTDVCDAEADVAKGFKLSTGATCQNSK